MDALTTSVAIATLAIYNLVITVLLVRLSPTEGMKGALSEKAVTIARIQAQGNTPTNPAAAAPPTNPAAAAPPDDPTSFGRVSGLIGAVVLACFIWSLGSVVIYQGLNAPEKIGPLLTGVAPFLLASSALFAPYAVNKISAIFPGK